MKKLLIAVLLTTLLLSGCGNAATENETVTESETIKSTIVVVEETEDYKLLVDTGASGTMYIFYCGHYKGGLEARHNPDGTLMIYEGWESLK